MAAILPSRADLFYLLELQSSFVFADSFSSSKEKLKFTSGFRLFIVFTIIIIKKPTGLIIQSTMTFVNSFVSFVSAL